MYKYYFSNIGKLFLIRHVSSLIIIIERNILLFCISVLCSQFYFILKCVHKILRYILSLSFKEMRRGLWIFLKIRLLRTFSWGDIFSLSLITAFILFLWPISLLCYLWSSPLRKNFFFNMGLTDIDFPYLMTLPYSSCFVFMQNILDSVFLSHSVFLYCRNITLKSITYQLLCPFLST